MSNLRFGQVQYKIMQVIWDHGRVNAKDITETLNKTKPIAHSTVQTHVENIYLKLGVNGRMQAVAQAQALKLV